MKKKTKRNWKQRRPGPAYEGWEERIKDKPAPDDGEDLEEAEELDFDLPYNKEQS